VVVVIEGEIQLRIISVGALVEFLRVLAEYPALPIQLKPCLNSSEGCGLQPDGSQFKRWHFQLLEQEWGVRSVDLIEVEGEVLGEGSEENALSIKVDFVGLDIFVVLDKYLLSGAGNGQSHSFELHTLGHHQFAERNHTLILTTHQFFSYLYHKSPIVSKPGFATSASPHSGLPGT